MRKLVLVFLISIVSSTLASSQDVYPYAVAGPDGIYVMCGRQIPRNFSYIVLRKEPGKNTWEKIATLSFYDHFDTFFNNVIKANGNNPAYELPSEKQKGHIWKWTQNTGNIDSIPYYGGIPMYREALGVAFYDREAQKNIKYEYKVLNTNSENEKITPVVSFPSPRVNYQITNTTCRAMEKYVSLEYEIAEKKHIHTVKLFRSYYLQSEFAPANASLGFNNNNSQLKVWALDTLVMRRGILLYYLQPYDLYGNPGVPSDTIRVTNLVNKDESWFEGIHATSVENGIKLSWKFEVPEYLRSIDIYKSENYDSSYVYLLSKSPNDTIFIDEDVQPNKNYFYYFIINNAYGKSDRSARVIGLHSGNAKAVAPVNLTAMAEPGRVILKWKNDGDNSKGYYIFRADGKSLDFIQVDGLFESDKVNVTYIDTLPSTLKSTSLAYYVKSENTSYDISPASDTVFANPFQADMTLTSAVNLSTHYSDNKILVSWDLVGELDENVLDYRLERRLNPGDGENPGQFEILANNTGHNYFEDTDILEGETYEYRVISLGINNLTSVPSISSICRVPIFRPVSISSLQVFKTENGYQLNWNKTGQENIKSYKIYRIQENIAPKLLATLDVDNTSYEDKVNDMETVFLYAVSCVNDSGIESKTEYWVGAD
ncbi:MAG: hypothetical protein CSA36_05445 [Draconibacterium sp.]|nr:MAG: hypothetical protein CSA36_05445 [Draconibacterium sp.]